MAPSTRAAIPPRTLQQRYDALANANAIRVRRAKIKRDIKAGRVTLYGILAGDVELALRTAKVYDLLVCIPKVGRVKANRILLQQRIAPSKTMGGLSARQRQELMLALARSTAGHRPDRLPGGQQAAANARQRAGIAA